MSVVFCAIESNSFIFNSVIGNYVNIRSGSYIDGAKIGEKSVIGPYAHLRPDSVIGKECRIGNFVETKKINMGDKSKAAFRRCRNWKRSEYRLRDSDLQLHC